MKRLFLDESGECSFSSNSNCKHFVITILSVEENSIYKIKNHLKRKFADFIEKGWDKTKEIKAVELYRKFGANAVKKVITSLVSIPSLEISYIVINKDRIEHQSFRNAPYGTAYNYFTGVLLSKLIFEDNFHNIYLIYDKKNKETHENKHFKEYLKTKLFGTAFEENINIDFSVDGGDSHKWYGLQAVDYFSWAIFRRFESGDQRFFNLFSERIRRRREWYIE